MSSDVLTFESIPTRDSKNQQVKLYCVVNDEEYVHKSPKGEKYFAYLGQVKERVKKVKKDKEVTEEDLKKLWLYDTNGESLKDYEQFSATSGYQGHRILQIAREDDKVVSLYPLGIQMYMWHPELNKSFQELSVADIYPYIRAMRLTDSLRKLNKLFLTLPHSEVKTRLSNLNQEIPSSDASIKTIMHNWGGPLFAERDSKTWGDMKLPTLNEKFYAILAIFSGASIGQLHTAYSWLYTRLCGKVPIDNSKELREEDVLAAIEEAYLIAGGLHKGWHGENDDPLFVKLHCPFFNIDLESRDIAIERQHTNDDDKWFRSVKKAIRAELRVIDWFRDEYATGLQLCNANGDSLSEYLMYPETKKFPGVGLVRICLKKQILKNDRALVVELHLKRTDTGDRFEQISVDEIFPYIRKMRLLDDAQRKNVLYLTQPYSIAEPALSNLRNDIPDIASSIALINHNWRLEALEEKALEENEGYLVWGVMVIPNSNERLLATLAILSGATIAQPFRVYPLLLERLLKRIPKGAPQILTQEDVLAVFKAVYSEAEAMY